MSDHQATLDAIDATLDGRCACGCGQPITDSSKSMWFATEGCQDAYRAHRNDPDDVPSPEELRRRHRAQQRLAQEGQEYGRWRESQMLGGGWLSARQGPVAWVRHCPTCNTYTAPADGIRPVRQTVSWLDLTTGPMVDTIGTERCNLCSRCRSYAWPGPHLTAYYQPERDTNLPPGYALRLESPTHKAVHKVALSFLVHERDRGVAHAWHELERYLAHESLPECVVPGCAEKGRLVFVAAEYGRLAGRAWEPGDEIRLCPNHGHDIYRAHGAYGLDQLAEWMQPDARYDALDAYDIGTDRLFGDQIRHSRARMLHLTRGQR